MAVIFLGFAFISQLFAFFLLPFCLIVYNFEYKFFSCNEIDIVINSHFLFHLFLFLCFTPSLSMFYLFYSPVCSLVWLLLLVIFKYNMGTSLSINSQHNRLCAHTLWCKTIISSHLYLYFVRVLCTKWLLPNRISMRKKS